MSGILVVVEQRDGRVARISWEAVAAGQRLAAQTGEPVIAVLIGAATESLAAEVATRSIAKVVRVEHPLLTHYTADGFSLGLQQLIENERPKQVVFPHTYQVRDYAPALAARLGEVLISDVVDIGDGPAFTRQLMQGRLNGVYKHQGSSTCFISVQAGAFRVDASDAATAPATITTFAPTIDAAQIRTKLRRAFPAGSGADG